MPLLFNVVLYFFIPNPSRHERGEQYGPQTPMHLVSRKLQPEKKDDLEVRVKVVTVLSKTGSI